MSDVAFLISDINFYMSFGYNQINMLLRCKIKYGIFGVELNLSWDSGCLVLLFLILVNYNGALAMRKKVTSILLGMAFIIALSGCAMAHGSDREQNGTGEDVSQGSMSTGEFDGLADANEGMGAEHADVGETGEIIFDVVYVTGENGRTAQVLEGHLYGFWDGMLYRYDLETKERIVLYESVVEEDLDFCIYEGKIYFTERDLADTLTFMDTRLYQVFCDGSGVRLLERHVPDDREEDRYARSCYNILVYDDIIYLKSMSGEDLYYRLEDRERPLPVVEACKVTRLREEESALFDYESILQNRESQRLEGEQVPEPYREIFAAYEEERRIAGEEANAYFETWEYSLEPATERNQYDSTDSLYEARIRQMFLTEDTEGARAINRCMEKVYEEKKKEFLAYPAEHREEMEEDFARQKFGTYDHITSGVDYLDERFVGIYVMQESFRVGGLYPGIRGEEYLFDRITGERLSITDLVENSLEEILDIVTPYIEKDHPSFAESEWPGQESILEEDRLFLSKSGIGIYYDTDELGSHGEGGMSYIIPFRKFDMKVGMSGEYAERYYVFDCVYSASLDEERGWEEDGYWKPEALEAELAREWEAGTLLEYLTEHDTSGRRELSQEEILSYIRGDYSDVYRQVREVCGGSERWFVVEEVCGNLEVIVVTEDGRSLEFDGGGKGLEVWEKGADCYFLSFEGDGYLVFPHLGENGEVAEIHTYGMMIDPYAGWRLWQRMEADGNIAKGWANYIVYY